MPSIDLADVHSPGKDTKLAEADGPYFHRALHWALRAVSTPSQG